MTLSLYTLHVVLMGRGWWPELETPDHYDDQVLIVLGVGAVLALVPLRGPLETVVAIVSRAAASPVARRWSGPPRRVRAEDGARDPIRQVRRAE